MPPLAVVDGAGQRLSLAPFVVLPLPLHHEKKTAGLPTVGPVLGLRATVLPVRGKREDWPIGRSRQSLLGARRPTGFGRATEREIRVERHHEPALPGRVGIGAPGETAR
jgi:hypothetical protein